MEKNQEEKVRNNSGHFPIARSYNKSSIPRDRRTQIADDTKTMGQTSNKRKWNKLTRSKVKRQARGK